MGALKFAILSETASIGEAMEAYLDFAELPVVSKNFKAISEVGEKPFNGIMCQVEQGEGIPEMVQAARASSRFTTTPVLLVTGGIPEDQKFLYEDFEFLTTLPPPFASGIFINSITTKVKFLTKNEKMLLIRRKLRDAMVAQDFEKALRLVKKLSKTDYDKWRLYYQYAKALYGTGDFMKALKMAKKSHKLNRENLGCRTLIATIYHNLGFPDKAKEILEVSFALAQKYVKYMVQLGDVFLADGQVDKSDVAYSKALETDPKNKDAKDGVVAVNLIKGNIATVKNHLKNDDSTLDIARICNMKGIGLVNGKKFDLAKQLYTNAKAFIENTPVEYKILLNLGLCMKKSGDDEEALMYFRKCAAVAPKDFMRATEQIESIEKKAAS